MDNLLQFIGLMRGAGALTVGAEASFNTCRIGRARLIVTASDASENTLEAAKAAAEEGNTPHIALPRGKAELGQALGIRDCAVFTICNTGFAIALCQKMDTTEPLEVLERRKRREQKKSRPRGKADTSARRGTKR